MSDIEGLTQRDDPITALRSAIHARERHAYAIHHLDATEALVATAREIVDLFSSDGPVDVEVNGENYPVFLKHQADIGTSGFIIEAVEQDSSTIIPIASFGDNGNVLNAREDRADRDELRAIGAFLQFLAVLARNRREEIKK